MLVRNLREQGDYERAIAVQDENLALAIANEQNVASARKNVAQGMIPQLTEKQLRSREEQVMDGLTTLNKAKNNLSTIFTPQQVESFMTGMTEEFADFVNVYWIDLKKEFETKRNLTKVYFDKIVQMFQRKLEQQAGISTERVNRPAESSSINEIAEIKKLIPDRELVRKLVMRLRDLNEDQLAQIYADFYYMLPPDSLMELIAQKPDVERQRLFEALQRLLHGINPNNRYWSGLLTTDRRSLIDLSRQQMPDLSNEGSLLQLYEDVVPGYVDAVMKERTTLLTKTLKRDIPPEDPRIPFGPPMRQSAFAEEPLRFEFMGQPAALPDPRMNRPTRPGRPAPRPPPVRSGLRFSAEEPTPADEANLGFAGFSQPAAVVRNTLGKSGKGMKSGKGIAPKQTVYHDLGKFLINGNALDNQLLQIKYQAGGSVPGFSKKIAISDTFQDILKTLVDTGKLNKSQFKELDDGERRALETILVKAGIGADFGIKTITPTDELKKKLDRFELLKGMYNAGNNGVEVIHELRSLVLHFMNIGRITRRDALATLMELQ